MNNSSTPPVATKHNAQLPFSYMELHSTLLKIFLWGASAFGLYEVISNLGRTTLVMTAGIIVIYLILLVATIFPLPTQLRAGILLAVIFILGLNELFQTGIFGNSRIFFLAFSLLAAILFGRREYLISLGICVVAMAFMGWLLVTGKITLISHEVTVGGLSTWIVETVLMILVATGLEECWRRLCKEFFVNHETLENAMRTLSNERVNLENHITERTVELAANVELEKKHAGQSLAIAEIGHMTAFIQEPDELMKALSQLISEKFGFYHVGIFLNDEDGMFTILQAANSPGGQRMLSRGYKLKIDQSGIVNYVASLGTPRLAGKIKDDILYDNNLDLPETRSIMALPLMIGQRIIGVLDLESNVEEAVKEQDLVVMRNLANQVADAIENIRTFSQTRRDLSEARVVYGNYMRQAWEQIAGEKRSVGYRYAASKISSIEAPLDLPDLQSSIDTGQSINPTSENQIITIPLKLREETIGVLDIRSNNPGRQWNENELALIQAIAERVSLALENARLFEETTRRADREKAVSEITTHIRSTTDPQVMLQTALDELKRALGAKDIKIRPYSPPAGSNG
jgi:GAF domain-containing protein